MNYCYIETMNPLCPTRFGGFNFNALISGYHDGVGRSIKKSIETLILYYIGSSHVQ